MQLEFSCAKSNFARPLASRIQTLLPFPVLVPNLEPVNHIHSVPKQPCLVERRLPGERISDSEQMIDGDALCTTTGAMEEEASI